ncbi:MAG: crotonobetainyl-CoA:carnitine CoA-transferase CaiB-like acyl-CoA transferase, partial [Oceanicoccus sp.]
MDQYVFAGLKVLDLGTVIAAPVAATILADFGADVIKVEPPGEGDLLRMLSDIPTTPDADNNFFWHMDARNKRSITLNLKTSEGMEILHRLIKECDVFITNQPFPVRRSLKLSYDDLKPLNPTMIYASLSAFGEEGPDRDKKAFDLYAYWARSGLMDLVRSPGSLPSQSLPGMGDHPTAIALYASIVTALLQRQKTGEGAMV